MKITICKKKQTNQFTFSFFIVFTQNTGIPLTNTVITKKLPINRDFDWLNDFIISWVISDYFELPTIAIEEGAQHRLHAGIHKY